MKYSITGDMVKLCYSPCDRILYNYFKSCFRRISNNMEMLMEDPLEKGKASLSSILAREFHGSMGLQRVGHIWATFAFSILNL